MTTLAEFTAKDSPYQSDREVYTAMTAALEADLQPFGLLEITFAAEILRATWRMQRLPVNGMNLDKHSTQHYARLRSGIQATIRWAMTELRRIQTARVLRDEIGLPNTLGLADPKEVAREARRAPKKAEQPAPAASAPQPPPASAPKTPPAAKTAKPNPGSVREVESLIASMLGKLESEGRAFMNERAKSVGNRSASTSSVFGESSLQGL